MAKKPRTESRSRSPSPEPARLQKLLANAGLGSRRTIERWIEQGRITVNGELAKAGDKATADDEIRLDGKRLALTGHQEVRVLAYHKPVGEIVSRDSVQRHATVFEALPKIHNGRWIAVGRLDLNTSGLLLFSNDGKLANDLMHPRNEVPRVYAVRVLGVPTEHQLENLRSGVRLDDGYAKFDVLEQGGGRGANRWYYVTLKEGRNREVRRLWESQGLTVSRLKRIAYGPIRLERGLRRGRYRELGKQEIRLLRQATGQDA